MKTKKESILEDTKTTIIFEIENEDDFLEKHREKILKSNLVLYVKTDGETLIIKNRYGKSDDLRLVGINDKLVVDDLYIIDDHGLRLVKIQEITKKTLLYKILEQYGTGTTKRVYINNFKIKIVEKV